MEITSSRLSAIQPSSSRTLRSQRGADDKTDFAAVLNSVPDGVRGKSPAQKSAPEKAAPETARFNALQQNWLTANEGPFANLLVNSLNRTAPYSIENVNLNWTNLSNGKPESSTRALGNVDVAGGAELARLLGGTLVDSPFGTFGTPQKDRYIRLPNGQTIDASVLANSLNAARSSKDPFASTQDILNTYKLEAQNFNLNRSTDAIDSVTKGTLNPYWSSLPT